VSKQLVQGCYPVWHANSGPVGLKARALTTPPLRLKHVHYQFQTSLIVIVP